MNKVIIRILCLLVASQICTLNIMAQEPAKINGTSSRKFGKTAVLYKIVAGEAKPLAQSDIQEDGSFGFLFTPQYEGFYMLGTVHEESLPGDPRGKIDLYFKGGEDLTINLTDSVYYLSGKKVSKESKVMYNWYQESNQLMTKGIEFGKVNSTYVDFFPELDRVVNGMPDFIKKNKTGNKVFDAYFPTYIDWSTMHYAINLIVTPRQVHPRVEEWNPYYDKMYVKNLTKNAAAFYRFPWAVRLLGNTQNLEMRRDKKPSFRDFDYTLSQTVNDTLKGDVVVRGLEGVRNQNRNAYEIAMQNYGKYIVTDEQKRRKEAVNVTMAQLKAGDQGMDFELPDVNGKNVKFADLRGKIVLIDVWATWCAPCKAEIPHMKRLEEEFKGTDLEIVSISTDNIADKEKWRKMVEKEQLGGIQLFTNGSDAFSKYYKVESIPRFILFDRDGKIIALHSARPSNPELKKQIAALLAKK